MLGTRMDAVISLMKNVATWPSLLQGNYQRMSTMTPMTIVYIAVAISCNSFSFTGTSPKAWWSRVMRWSQTLSWTPSGLPMPIIPPTPQESCIQRRSLMWASWHGSEFHLQTNQLSHHSPSTLCSLSLCDAKKSHCNAEAVLTKEHSQVKDLEQELKDLKSCLQSEANV